MKYKLLIAYDGTAYLGWQVQAKGDTIQGKIQDALKIILQEPVTLIGAGRTDTGVHARGQVAHFVAPTSLEPFRLRGSLNGLLPKDIRILQVEEVDDDFHAQYSARSKCYHYHLWLEPVQSPTLRFYTAHFPEKIDLPLLRAAAKQLIGKFDFSSFANVSRDEKIIDTHRHLHRLEIIEQEGGIRLEFEGDGFLYKMVRNLVGTLLEIGTQKRPLEDLPKILAAKDRKAAGRAAPPQGLFLMKVFY